MLQKTIPHLANKNVLVIGDIILDEYLLGQATRLSREAPIPVLEFQERRTVPGGAANPAMNIVALGSMASIVGIAGDDESGKELVKWLNDKNVDSNGIIITKGRCTTRKTRIVSQNSVRFPQQVARLDRIDRRPLNPAIEPTIIQQIGLESVGIDAILVSDYRNGMLTPNVIQAILKISNELGNLLVVDSQGNLDKYHGYHIIRVNDRDLSRYLNRPLENEVDFERACVELLEALEAKAIVIGRGAEGVSIQGQSTPYHHFPAINPSEVFDVTGAGDTSVAVLTLGMIVGLDVAESALLANHAASLVVRKLGNATVTLDELACAVKKPLAHRHDNCYAPMEPTRPI
ncbi:MAG: hypothetical protein B6242_01955 [Anaerolineaceae bacterium 4572_78]|nr:MAG: hypothetical protein B6242_01955 [Anaerolineaceae bacterium 4572_78]